MPDQLLRNIYGIDIGFDHVETKDTRTNQMGDDFEYVGEEQALAEELYRLFDLTPKGSFFDDPSYGVDWEWIGRPVELPVMLTLTKLEVMRALKHPSFRDRFKVLRLDCVWTAEQPNAIYLRGILGLFGFEALDAFEFSYRLRSALYGER